MAQINKCAFFISITCLWIASKYFEIIPLRLFQVKAELAHYRTTKEQIILKEQQILQEL